MFGWMLWTTSSIIGFSVIFGIIIVVNIIDVFRPGYARKGFLPITTTRGDRVFICLVCSILVFFLWMKFVPPAALLYSLAVVLPMDFVLMTWG
jgi:predicted small integral membrane protein